MGRVLFRYWGWAALAASIASMVTGKLGLLAPVLLALASVGYFLVQAPTQCRAVNRDGKTWCRNNASGLIMGCHIRQHRRQMLTMAFVPRNWRRFNEGLWSEPAQRTATVASLAGAVSAIAAVVPLVFR